MSGKESKFYKSDLLGCCEDIREAQFKFAISGGFGFKQFRSGEFESYFIYSDYTRMDIKYCPFCGELCKEWAKKHFENQLKKLEKIKI